MSTNAPDEAEIEIRRRAKLALRKRMRAVRGALPASACDARSAEITKRVLELEELRRAQTVLCFASIDNEVRTQSLLGALWETDKRVALPRVGGDDLTLHLTQKTTRLRQGAYDVPEPPDDTPLVEPETVEFAFVPALAVDPRGFRIGYGGGFYDRLLPRLARACSCALAYDFQLVSEVPELAFDVPVDMIVTDRRVIRAG